MAEATVELFELSDMALFDWIDAITQEMRAVLIANAGDDIIRVTREYVELLCEFLYELPFRVP